MQRALLYFLTIVSLSSCYSYKLFPKEYRDFAPPKETRTAYVVNKELKREYKILEASKLFQLTNDSSDLHAIKVTLYPIKQRFVCGQPILAYVVFLGQLPVYFPDQYQYTFDEKIEGLITRRHFELQVTKRYWFWDMFTFDKNFKAKAGQALLANYHQR